MRKLLIAFLILMMGLGQAQANCGTYNHVFSWNAGSSLPCNEFNGNGIFNQNSPGFNVTQSFDFTQGVLPPGLTFSRASSATEYNSSGTLVLVSTNVPRFDYNPSTLALNGLLLEEGRTNLQTQSNFSTWSVSQATLVPNAIVSPDGTMDMNSLTDNATNAAHTVFGPGVAFTSGTIYTVSFFAKAGTGRYAQFFSNATIFSGFANFDLQTGTPGSSSGAISTSMQPIGNGIYRCSVTYTAAASSTQAIGVAMVTSSTDVRQMAYAGTGSTFYLYGIQAEAGSFATSYISTTTAIATRSGDSLAANSITWFNQTQGSFIIQYLTEGNTGSGVQAPFYFSDGTLNNVINAFGNYGGSGNNMTPKITVAGVGNSGVSIATTAGMVKVGISLNGSANVFAFNGSTSSGGAFATSAISTGINKLNFLNNSSGSNTTNAWLQMANYYNFYMTQTQLQVATQ